MSERLEKRCPYLQSEGYEVTSPATDLYNCVAWAVGDDQRWWEPSDDPKHYWPPGVPLEYTYQSYLQALATQGFAPCADAELEAGFEKIAVYANARGELTHMARQLADGRWTSKMGDWEDIEHTTLAALNSHFFGTAKRFLKRPLPLNV